MRVRAKALRRTGALLSAVTLLLVACGGGDTATEQTTNGDGGDPAATEDGGDGSGTGELPTVAIQAVEGSVGGLPLMLMEREGLDEKHGFEGDFQFLASEGALQNFLMGGEGISVDSDIIGTAISRNEGFDVTAFYPVGNLYLGIVVPEDSDIQDPTDLVGRRVGHFGMDSGTTSFLRVLLQEGWDVDVTEDIEFVEVGPAALGELLASGEIDAMFNFEAFTSQAIENVPGRWLLKAHTAYQEHFDGFAPWITNMIAHTDWLEQNPEIAYAVRGAYDEALQMLNDSDYQVVNDPYYMEQLGIEDQAVMDTLVENAASTPYFTNDWSEETIDQAQQFLQDLADQDILIEEVPDGVMTRLEDIVEDPRS